MDLNYGRETPLLASARDAAVGAADGLLMLLHQAARGFEIWTDKPAPVEVMRRAADAELRKRRL
jgi:shikimate dehydrogenase